MISSSSSSSSSSSRRRRRRSSTWEGYVERMDESRGLNNVLFEKPD
jgi:hypothetical protein